MVTLNDFTIETPDTISYTFPNGSVATIQTFNITNPPISDLTATYQGQSNSFQDARDAVEWINFMFDRATYLVPLGGLLDRCNYPETAWLLRQAFSRFRPYGHGLNWDWEDSSLDRPIECDCGRLFPTFAMLATHIDLSARRHQVAAGDQTR